jgi:hypothetical protein
VRYERKQVETCPNKNSINILQPTSIQGVQENAEKNPRKDREKEESLKLSRQNKQQERAISHL